MARMGFEDGGVMDGETEDGQRYDSVAARKAARAGLSFMAAALAIAVMWLGGIGAAVWLTIGPDGAAALSRMEMVGVALAGLLPASLILFCGMAAREGARARAEARRLADAADRMLNPSATARNAATRVGAAVRQEIDTLDRALAGMLSKLHDTQTAVAQQSSLVDAAADRARTGAQHMISGMDRERDALVRIATDLNAQATLIGDQISRHARVLAEAAHTAETEVRAADLALDQRLSAFSAATSLIGDRTHALHAAAQASADSALRLETALSSALDVLAKATSLTDAARQNAEQASRAADNTAGAVRDTTARAIDDAKHAADLIRAEAAAMEREAARAIERLREAAYAARAASDEVRASAGAAVAAHLEARQVPAPPPEGPHRPRATLAPQRPNLTPAPAPVDDLDSAWAALEHSVAAPAAGPASNGGLGAGADARPTAAPMFAPPQSPTPAPLPAAKPRRPSFAEQLSGVAFGRATPTPAAPQAANVNAAAEPRRDRPSNSGGGWRWRDMLAAIDREDRKAAAPAPRPDPAPSTRVPPPSPNSFEAPFNPAPINAASIALEPQHAGARASSSPAPAPASATANAAIGLSARGTQMASIVGLARHPLPIVRVLDQAGLHLSEVFSPDSLDRIAHRARNGTQARRRAVRETAPDAVLRLEAMLGADMEARLQASAFLRSEGARIAELLGRGRAAMTADATRAFLLLDAAAI